MHCQGCELQRWTTVHLQTMTISLSSMRRAMAPSPRPTPAGPGPRGPPLVHGGGLPPPGMLPRPPYHPGQPMPGMGFRPPPAGPAGFRPPPGGPFPGKLQRPGAYNAPPPAYGYGAPPAPYAGQMPPYGGPPPRVRVVTVSHLYSHCWMSTSPALSPSESVYCAVRESSPLFNHHKFDYA